MYIVKFIKFIDRIIHVKFQFLNSGGKNNFNKNYEWIYKYLTEEKIDLTSRTFIEVGSRDCLDSLDILSKFNFLKAYVFEPSYAGIKESIKNQEENINLSKKLLFFPFALGDNDGKTNFYQYISIPKTHTKPNIGASTIYGDGQESEFLEYEVPIFQLDSLRIDFTKNYLIIMDAQSSEFSVLRGAIETLKNNKYVCLETKYGNKIEGCVEIKKLLEENNYKLIDCDWPDTPKESLPSVEVTKDSEFCLLFENKSYKPLESNATK